MLNNNQCRRHHHHHHHQIQLWSPFQPHDPLLRILCHYVYPQYIPLPLSPVAIRSDSLKSHSARFRLKSWDRSRWIDSAAFSSGGWPTPEKWWSSVGIIVDDNIPNCFWKVIKHPKKNVPNHQPGFLLYIYIGKHDHVFDDGEVHSMVWWRNEQKLLLPWAALLGMADRRSSFRVCANDQCIYGKMWDWDVALGKLTISVMVQINIQIKSHIHR